MCPPLQASPRRRVLLCNDPMSPRRAVPLPIFLLSFHLLLGLALLPADEDLPFLFDSNRMIPMRDGTQLAANVFRPKADGRYPVILMRSPYGKPEANFGDAKRYTAAGYAMVLQDCRGRGKSEGSWDPFRYDVYYHMHQRDLDLGVRLYGHLGPVFAGIGLGTMYHRDQADGSDAYFSSGRLLQLIAGVDVVRTSEHAFGVVAQAGQATLYYQETIEQAALCLNARWR